MKKKLLLTLFSVILAVSATMSVLFTASAAAETKTTWSAVQGVYEGVSYAAPGNDFWMGRDANGDLFYQTESGTPHQILTDRKMYVEGFEMEVTLASTDASVSFNEGSSYLIGLSNTSQGMMMAGIKFTYTNGAFDLSYVSAGLNLFNFTTPVTVAPGDNVNIKFIKGADGALHVIVDGIDVFVAGGIYPSFMGSADYTFPADEGGYYGYFNVYNDYHLANGANINNRMTFHVLKGGEPKQTETKTTWSAVQGVYDGVNYANPAADFWMGKNGDGSLFYQTEAGNVYQVLTDKKMYVEGFEMEVDLAPTDASVPFNEGNTYLIGLSNASQGMMMAGIKFTYTNGAFDLSYVSAGLNLFGFTTPVRVAAGEKVLIQFIKGADGALHVLANGVDVFVAGGIYPSYMGSADHTFPSDEGGYYGYFNVFNNMYHQGGSANVNNRITFHKLSDDGPYQAESKTTWSAVGGVYEGVSYANPAADFWMGRDGDNSLFYQTEAGNSYQVLTDMKMYVEGFEMEVTLASTDASVSFNEGSSYLFGLSHQAQGMLMAGIKFTYTKGSFVLSYASAGLNIFDFTTPVRVQAGERVNIKLVKGADGALHVLVNDVDVFIAGGIYPSFMGSADYTFPSDEGGYYGYFNVYNDYHLANGANINNRITFHKLSSGTPAQPEIPEVKEEKTTWSAVGGVYEGVNYANPAADFWMGRDVDGNLFYQTEAGHSYQVLTDMKMYVEGFELDVALASTDESVDFAEGSSYLIGLSNTSQGMMMAGIKFTYTNGAFDLSYVSAGLNLFNFTTPVRVQAGERVSIKLIKGADGALHVLANGVDVFVAGGIYPSFMGSADYTFPSDDKGYYGYFNVYNDYHLANGANINNRMTFYTLKGEAPEPTKEDKSISNWASLSGGVFEGDTYVNPANDFWMGRDGDGKLFYQTERGAPYQALTDKAINVEGFKLEVEIDTVDPVASFNEGNTYLIGLSNVSQGMMMAGIKFTYTNGAFALSYVTAGLNLYDFTTPVTVEAGERVAIEFAKGADGALHVLVNGADVFVAGGLYPSYMGSADFTFPSVEGVHYGYFNVFNNLYHQAGSTNVHNRITFHSFEYEAPVIPDPKDEAPEDLDETLDEDVNLKTWSSLVGGTYESSRYGDMSYGNPNSDFWVGEDADGHLVYQSEAHAYNAMSSAKAYVNGFKMTFMIQSLDQPMADGTVIYIGLSNAYQGMTMAAIQLKYNGKYFEMRYSTAGVTNLDGNELSTYGEIGHLWLGQQITFEYKEDADGNLQIWINGEYAFTTGQYPSFNGLADYTFPADEGGYYGYFSVHNGTVLSSANRNRITFYELSIVPEVDEDYDYEAVEGLYDTANKQTFSGGAFEGVTYANSLSNDFWMGRDVYGSLFYQTEAGKPYSARSDRKAYVDGFTMSFMIQATDGELADGTYYILGLANSKQGSALASIYLVWSAKNQSFSAYYRSAGLTNGDGGRLDTYSDDLHKLHLGERMTIQFKENAEGKLDIYMNGIYTFTTSQYPAFQGMADYCFPSDANGYYGYLTVYNSCGLPVTEGNVGSRLTFFDLDTNGVNSGDVSVYDADDASTYLDGTTIGFIANDFTYGTIVSGPLKGATIFNATAGALSFEYTEIALLNAFGIALAPYYKGVNAASYTLSFTDAADLSKAIKVKLIKASLTSARVVLITAEGEEELGTVKLDWMNVNGTEIYNVGLFINADNAILTVDSASYVLSDSVFAVLSSFGKNADGKAEGIVEIIAEGADLAVSEVILDGTAVQKKIAKAIVTTLADVEVEHGAEFVNPYSAVDVLFYNGETETLNVIWNTEGVNTAFAAKYAVYGAFEEMSSEYYIPEGIKQSLIYNVSVKYEEGFIKYGTTDYSGTSSVWYTCGGGSNNFLYRDNGDGTETIVSDGYTNGQFMPATTVYRDIEGYTFNYNVNYHSAGGMLIFTLLPEAKHPVEFGTKYIGLQIVTNANGNAYINFYTAAGSLEAYLYNGGEGSREVSVAGQQLAIRSDIVETAEGERYVKFYFTVGGVEYEVLAAGGAEYTAAAWVLESFIDERAHVMLWNEQGMGEITFSEDYRAYVASYARPDDVIVDFGSEHGLPTEVELVLNNGKTVIGTVTYTGEYNKELAGTYSLVGNVSYEGDLALGNGVTIFDGASSTFDVKVTVREDQRIITTFEKQEDITIEIGGEYNLPDKVTVSIYSAYYGTTEQVEISIVWAGSVNALAAGTYTLTAQPVGNYVFDEAIAEDTVAINVIVSGDTPVAPGGEPIVQPEGCYASASVASVLAIVAILGAAVIVKRKED